MRSSFFVLSCALAATAVPAFIARAPNDAALELPAGGHRSGILDLSNAKRSSQPRRHRHKNDVNTHACSPSGAPTGSAPTGQPTFSTFPTSSPSDPSTDSPPPPVSSPSESSPSPTFTTFPMSPPPTESSPLPTTFPMSPPPSESQPSPTFTTFPMSPPPSESPSETPTPTDSSSSDSPTPTNPPSTTESPTPTDSSSTDVPTSSSAPSSPDTQEYLDAHNNERANHGAAPLTWDDSLAALAAQWTAKCVFQHSGGSLASFGYGENLAAGSGMESATAAVMSWNNESSQYDPNNPQYSHWTQVVWKSTTTVGCASSQCAPGTIFDASFGSATFHSCVYTPPGNVIGEFADNVQA